MKIKKFNEMSDNNSENTGTTRETTPIEKEVMRFLNDIRDSGSTNMFGASTYILEEFPELNKSEARKILSLWMENFNEEGDYDQIEE